MKSMKTTKSIKILKIAKWQSMDIKLNFKRRLYCRTALLIFLSLLMSCGADYEERAFSCLGTIWYQLPAVTLEAIDESANVGGEQMCEGLMFTQEQSGKVTLGGAHFGGEACYYSTKIESYVDDETVLELSVFIPGFKVRRILNIHPSDGKCNHLDMSIVFTPSPLDCADGYYDRNGQCQTPQGCTYPQVTLREAYLNVGDAQLSSEQACARECPVGYYEITGQCWADPS